MSEPLYNDAGQYLGDIHDADDGAKVLVDPNGVVLGASTPDGQALDHTAYTVESGGPSEAQAVLDARRQADAELLAALGSIKGGEERAETDFAEQNFNDDIRDQSATLHRVLGRAPTTAETARIAEISSAQMARGEGPDLMAAASQLHDEGGLIDADTLRGQSQLIAGMITEHEQAEQAEEREHDEGFALHDVDTAAGRADAINALHSGAVDRGEAALFDSSYPEPVEQLE